MSLGVLVNSGTASAAEIVSGAMQDLDVGVVIGQDKTFGKGLVQNVETLPYNTALKYTVAKYYTPSGRCVVGRKRARARTRARACECAQMSNIWMSNIRNEVADLIQQYTKPP